MCFVLCGYLVWHAWNLRYCIAHFYRNISVSLERDLNMFETIVIYSMVYGFTFWHKRPQPHYNALNSRISSRQRNFFIKMQLSANCLQNKISNHFEYCDEFYSFKPFSYKKTLPRTPVRNLPFLTPKPSFNIFTLLNSNNMPTYHFNIINRNSMKNEKTNNNSFHFNLISRQYQSIACRPHFATI